MTEFLSFTRKMSELSLLLLSAMKATASAQGKKFMISKTLHGASSSLMNHSFHDGQVDGDLPGQRSKEGIHQANAVGAKHVHTGAAMCIQPPKLMIIFRHESSIMFSQMQPRMSSNMSQSLSITITSHVGGSATLAQHSPGYHSSNGSLKFGSTRKYSKQCHVHTAIVHVCVIPLIAWNVQFHLPINIGVHTSY